MSNNTTCREAIECCVPLFAYAIQDSPTYYNTEQSYTAQCPSGFICYPNEVTVTIAAGTVSFTPGSSFTAPGDLDGCHYDDAQEYVNCLAYNQAKSQAEAQISYDNTEPGSTFFNTQQTIECDGATVGQDYVVAAGLFSSLISQADANNQAIAYGQTQICCNEGDPTPEDLSIEDIASLGQVAVTQVNTTNDTSFGTFTGWGTYKLVYVDGYWQPYQDGVNPVYSGNGLKVRFFVDSGGSGFFTDNLPIQFNSDNPAVIEASFAGVESGEFQSGGGEIQLRWDGWIQDANYDYPVGPHANGSPNPTWALEKLRSLLPMPATLAITNWGSIKPQLTPCASCQTDAGGRPEWDGTFNFLNIRGYDNIQWHSISEDDWYDVSGELGTLALNGKWEGWSTIYYSDDLDGITPSGAGWVLMIVCVELSGLRKLVWNGVKGYGENPVGRYCRAGAELSNGTPCVTGPPFIDIEGT